jgi:hypothetical protein
MIGYLRLTRIANRPRFGAFGAMKIDEEPLCVTLEPPDKQNAVKISCIPPGQYIATRFKSPKYGSTWRVQVHGRTYILFHAGNVKKHTKGCILVAEHYGKLVGNLAVLNSGRTFKRFMVRTMKYSELHITVRECF